MSASMLLVVFQIVLMWAVVSYVALYAQRRDGRAPLDDIGFFWLLALGLYVTLPAISWLIQGGSYSVLSGRLYRFQPEPAEVSSLLNIGLAYAFSFAVIYLRMRRTVAVPDALAHGYIGNSRMAAAVVILLLGILFGVVLGSSGLLRGADSYGDSYAAMLALPLPVRQLVKIISQFQLVATIVLTIALVQRWPRSRPWLVLYLLSVILTFDPEGSRTVLARAVLTVAVVWHVLVRPISFRKFIAGGLLALLAFLALGAWRAIRALGGDFAGTELDGVLNQGEFDVLWGNAVELLQHKRAGDLDVPDAVRFIELFEFVPSQLLWFEKTSLSIWYLDTFYPVYKDSGGGLAFGALAQAAIGGGVLEALARGSALGAIAGWLMRWIRRPSTAWWRLPLYLYLLITAYQSVRDTTFSAVSFLIQGVIPALIFMAVMAVFVSSARGAADTQKAA